MGIHTARIVLALLVVFAALWPEAAPARPHPAPMPCHAEAGTQHEPPPGHHPADHAMAGAACCRMLCCAAPMVVPAMPLSIQERRVAQLLVARDDGKAGLDSRPVLPPPRLG